MKAIRILVLAGAVLGAVPILLVAKNGHPTQARRITPCAPGVVYLRFTQGSTVPNRIGGKGGTIQSIGADAFSHALAKLGLRKIVAFDAQPDSISRAFGIDRIYALYYSNFKIEPHRALAMLESSSEVECGSVRYLFPESLTPNDPLLSQQYALAAMNVYNAWSHTTGDTSIVIADVDCAINIDHEDLKNQVKINWGETGLDGAGKDKRANGVDDDHDGYVDNWEGWDVAGDVDVSGGAMLEPNNDPRPREDGASHGTHTAGCILAQGNNGLGIAGVAYGCRLLPVKAAGSDFENIGASYEGVHYASTHGARIINCSWGGLMAYNDTELANSLLLEAHARGALIVAAAGNGIPGVSANGVSNDTYPEYPGNGPYVLSVGATDQTNGPAFYSNYGHSVSVWAPGSQVLSCDYPGNSSYSPEDGTSFASPNTAGVAGLIVSKYPTLPPEFLARQIVQTVKNVVKPSDRAEYWGLVDADSALSMALWPGLVITKYQIDGVPSDSLGYPDKQQDLNVTFENIVANGTGITAQLVPGIGYSADTAAVILGTMPEQATASADFHIIRSGIYSEGLLTLKFYVTDGKHLADTLTLSLPLKVIPGFVLERPALAASSIKRVTNTVAWATFGNLFSDGATAVDAAYAQEQGGAWSDTATLQDGTVAPFDIEALDSLTAWFGTGQASSGSVIYTTDGGENFNSVDCTSFTPFVDGIHFFDRMHGILIGDPKSGRWGIGVTSDGGQSWHPLARPIVASGTSEGWNNSVAWVGQNGWFGTNSRQIYRTTDGGQSWIATHTGSEVNALSVAFADDATHGFACFRAVTQSGSTTGSNGMMVSSDSGASWDTLQALPAPGISPSSVAFVPGSTTAILTTNLGVFRTTDLGATWAPIGIPTSYNPDNSELSISRGDGDFVASINSSAAGIAEYTEAMSSEGVREGAPPSELLLSVNPNPVEGDANISFVLPSSERVQVSLFDALGRKLKTLADRTFGAGTNQLALRGSMFSPGVYYVDLRTDSGAQQSHSITILP